MVYTGSEMFLNWLIPLSAPLILNAVAAEFSSKCVDKTPIPKYDEALFHAIPSITWYQYAGSLQCENCCNVQNIVAVKSPNVFDVEIRLQNGSESKPTIIKQTLRKDSTSAVYYYENDPDPIIVLDTDSRTYVVAYKTGQDILTVFASSTNPDSQKMDSLERIAKCNMKIFKYHPEIACK